MQPWENMITLNDDDDDDDDDDDFKYAWKQRINM